MSLPLSQEDGFPIGQYPGTINPERQFPSRSQSLDHYLMRTVSQLVTVPGHYSRVTVSSLDRVYWYSDPGVGTYVDSGPGILTTGTVALEQGLPGILTTGTVALE